MSGALQRCLEECLKLITLSVIGNRFAVVAVEIRPPPVRTKIGALACYGEPVQKKIKVLDVRKIKEIQGFRLKRSLLCEVMYS